MALTSHDRCDGNCPHKMCIHKVPIFSSLSQEHLVKIASLIGHRQYKKGDILFHDGAAPNSLTILNEGSVKAYKYTPDGREQILYIFSEGDFFGEQYLFGDRKAAYTVEALEPVKICTLSKEHFRHLLLTHPGIALKIIEELEERIGRLENSMQSMGVRSVNARVSSFLLDFAIKHGTPLPEGTLIRLPLSREGIANYLGIARETVSRKLGQLENENIIRSVSNKNILVLNQAALEESAGKIE